MTDEPLVARRLRQIAEELRRIVAELRDGEDPDVLASELDECADALDAIREGVKP